MRPRKLNSYLQSLMIVTIFIFLQFSQSKGEEVNGEDDYDEELHSVIHLAMDSSVLSRSIRSIDRVNRTTGNDTRSDDSLWSDLWYACGKKASFSCIGTGIFKHLDRTLEKPGDSRLTDSIVFRRNKNKWNGICENSLEERENRLRYEEEKLKASAGDEQVKDEKIDAGRNETKETTVTVTVTSLDRGESPANNSTGEEKSPEEERDTAEGLEEDEEEDGVQGRSIKSLGDLSEILYDKGSNFLMTHDTEFDLPKFFFGGGSIKIEPKSYVEGSEDEEEGALVKIVFKPPQTGTVAEGRVLHHLKRLFKKKLMHSFMALVLIIKMIKVKLMFLLPMIIGKATAKKLLLKVLLFLIPGLAHLFKLCHYYHMEHAKYHHHHHKIKHHHHTVKVPVPVPVPVHFESHNHLEEDEYDKPTGFEYPAYHSHGPEVEGDYEGSQEIYGNKGYGILSHYNENEAHLSSWGLGMGNYQDAGVLDAKNQPLFFKNHPYGGYNFPDHEGSFSHHRNVINPQLVSKHQPQISAAFDPFYSPILHKIDNIFGQMGFHDEPCRERLVCSMYKTPQRFSPHSNLLSHELSRDSRELQKPVRSNMAVLRFYKYVQAARDGQEGKDCLKLYSACRIKTE